MLSTGIGFLPDILQILQSLPPKNRKKWQGMCFSATFPSRIQKVLSCIMSNDYTTISTVGPSEVPTIAGLPQFSVLIPTVADTFAVLLSLIKHEIAASSQPKIIVFGVTAAMVRLYARFLKNQTGLKVFEMHSRLTQGKRGRETDGFKVNDRAILCASDGTLATL